ncbi:hypothetical protein K9L27_01285 [Candidatus Gracilibacteria bacterium]|nr:hypothetical protein [Candidatus Gracilibacteria bacterium]
MKTHPTQPWKLFFLLLGFLLFSGQVFAVGKLEVSQYSYSDHVPKNGVRIPLLTLRTTAKEGDVSISDIIVLRRGLSTASDFGRLIAITNDYRRSMNGNLSNEDLATLNFRIPLLIEKDTTQEITVYGNLQFESDSRTFSFALQDIHSDATSINFLETPQAPLKSESKNISAIRLQSQTRPSFKIVCRNKICYRTRR